MPPMTRTALTAPVAGGQLVGWHQGRGVPVLLLHGGPGLSFTYMDPLAAEFTSTYLVASYQQRGLPPSMTDGPFTVETAVADAVAVLDALGWERAYVVGHSWGGHLLLHLALAAPHRLLGALAVDPLGGVGDGGLHAFQREMAARMAPAAKARMIELDERARQGAGTAEDFAENLRLLWPAYFADPAQAPPMPDIETSVAAYAGGFDSLTVALPALTAALPTMTVPFGFVAGGASPMPADQAATATAALIPGAFVEVIGEAGHFPWSEKPGSVRAAFDRLVGLTPASGTGGAGR
jgi:pimeloyl-ACP methyl ester carboxylesterase